MKEYDGPKQQRSNKHDRRNRDNEDKHTTVNGPPHCAVKPSECRPQCDRPDGERGENILRHDAYADGAITHLPASHHGHPKAGAHGTAADHGVCRRRGCFLRHPTLQEGHPRRDCLQHEALRHHPDRKDAAERKDPRSRQHSHMPNRFGQFGAVKHDGSCEGSNQKRSDYSPQPPHTHTRSHISVSCRVRTSRLFERFVWRLSALAGSARCPTRIPSTR